MALTMEWGLLMASIQTEWKSTHYSHIHTDLVSDALTKHGLLHSFVFHWT